MPIGSPIECHLQPTRSAMILFFFNDTATTEIYTLSLHDALPISRGTVDGVRGAVLEPSQAARGTRSSRPGRSEEHTSELQSRLHLVCRLLLEKKIYRDAKVKSRHRLKCGGD